VEKTEKRTLVPFPIRLFPLLVGEVGFEPTISASNLRSNSISHYHIYLFLKWRKPIRELFVSPVGDIFRV